MVGNGDEDGRDGMRNGQDAGRADVANRDPDPSHSSGDTELGRVLQSIHQLQSLSFPVDATERSQQVDLVQDELIKQLDELNELVQKQICRLTNGRNPEQPLASTNPTV